MSPRGDGVRPPELARRARLPAIVVEAAHADRLADLAEATAGRAPEVAAFLLGELDRARIVTRLPADVVTIGSWVTYTDRASGESRTVQLVYPDRADIAAGRISVLTPIGAALLGLSVGQAMGWRTRTGVPRDLIVTAVGHEPPPGATGAGGAPVPG
jgi:regulator of nucleoside diphosphate kinase